MTKEEEEFLRTTFFNLGSAFMMMALATVSNKPREELFNLKVGAGGEVEIDLNLPSEFRAAFIPKDKADALRERVVRGDVTCIVANPEPFVWLYVKVGEREFRCVYGLWIGRPASWRGKINPTSLPHMAMTPSEAEQKGIPVLQDVDQTARLRRPPQE